MHGTKRGKAHDKKRLWQGERRGGRAEAAVKEASNAGLPYAN